MRNRSQVSTARLDISRMQQIPETMGSTGFSGARNGRRMSGRLVRSTGTAMDTTRNANNMPMLTISARSAGGTKAASTATTATVSAVINTGVFQVGWILRNTGG